MSDSPETLILNVDEAADGVRIDKFLSDTLTEYSRSFIQKIIKDLQSSLISVVTIIANIVSVSNTQSFKTNKLI